MNVRCRFSGETRSSVGLRRDGVHVVGVDVAAFRGARDGFSSGNSRETTKARKLLLVPEAWTFQNNRVPLSTDRRRRVVSARHPWSGGRERHRCRRAAAHPRRAWRRSDHVEDDGEDDTGGRPAGIESGRDQQAAARGSRGHRHLASAEALPSIARSRILRSGRAATSAPRSASTARGGVGRQRRARARSSGRRSFTTCRRAFQADSANGQVSRAAQLAPVTESTW